jgi:hypothetical protein
MAGATAAAICNLHGLSFDDWDIYVANVEQGARLVESGRADVPKLNLYGEGGLLVYNTKAPARLWRIEGRQQSLIRSGPSILPVVSVEGGRVAILREDVGLVDIRGDDGRILDRVGIGKGSVGAVVLTGDRLVVQRNGRLLVFDVESGALVRSIRLRPGGLAKAHLRDAAGGYAVYLAGIAIHVVRLSDGRDRALELEREARWVDVQLEPQGLFYGYNEVDTTRPGRLAFVALRELARGIAATGPS